MKSSTQLVHIEEFRRDGVLYRVTVHKVRDKLYGAWCCEACSVCGEENSTLHRTTAKFTVAQQSEPARSCTATLDLAVRDVRYQGVERGERNSHVQPTVPAQGPNRTANVESDGILTAA